MKTVIVGTGLIGRAWAISFARAGHEVMLWNRRSQGCAEALAYIEQALPELARQDLLRGLQPSEVLALVSAANDLEAAVADADWIQENLVESVEAKKEIFSRLDAAAKADAIIASSTSGIVPSLFTDDLPGRHRCLVAHPLNPPYLMPAVDLVPAPWTSPETMERAADVMRASGQVPIVMKREDTGFVTIRMQGAIYQEAFRLVADGLASPEDVDVAVREGLALRWSFIGPFETADLNAPNGIRDFVERYRGLYDTLARRDGPVAWDGALLDGIEADRRGKLPMEDHKARQRWRDGRLMALAAHKVARSKAEASS